MPRDYFPDIETMCRCGCEENTLHPDTKAMFNTAREHAGIPFIFTSCTRCIEHNREVGGKDDSAHLTTSDGYSYAADILVRSSRERYLILSALLDAGFDRIGIGAGFIHADDSPHKDDIVIWVYA